MTDLSAILHRIDNGLATESEVELSHDELVAFVGTGAADVLRAHAASEAAAPVPEIPPFCPDCCETYIYFIRQGDHGPVKIGYSTKPLDRLHALQISFPTDLHMIALFKAPQSFEGALHNALRPEHLRGEWYRASDRLLAYAAARGVLPYRKTRKHRS